MTVKARLDEKLSSREAWLENSIAYYTNPDGFDVPFAATGPKEWPRVKNATETPDRIPVADPARVTQIQTSDDRISFHVENTGSPVVVRASYFPNWEVKGGKGPYRLTPNTMVVIPTSNDVSMHYGRTSVDWLGIGLTLPRTDRRRLARPRRPPSRGPARARGRISAASGSAARPITSG